MKITHKLIALASALAAFAVTSARAESFFQFGLWAPDLQIVAADKDVKGLRIDIVYGENKNMTGLDWGFVHVTTGDFVGAGLGLANIVEGSAKGVQWGWYSDTKGEFVGWQSGLLARLEGEGRGLHTGLVTWSETSFTGLQWGLVNKAENMKGLQVGVVNIAENLEGLQIGLANIAQNSDVFWILPIVNWQF